MTNEIYHIHIHFDEDGKPWKEYDDAEVNSIPVTIHGFSENGMFYKHNDEIQFRWSPTQLFKRPTPKVYDADGVEIEVGDTVYNVNSGNGGEVKGFDPCEFVEVYTSDGYHWKQSGNNLTHEQPVFDAEGERICKGNTVWHKKTGEKHFVEELTGDGGIYIDRSSLTWSGDMFIHREPDSLEKLRDDMSDYLDACSEEWHELREYADRLSALIKKDA